LDALVLKEFTPETQATRERLFEVTVAAEGPISSRVRDWIDGREMVRNVVRLLSSGDSIADTLRLGANLVDDLEEGRVPMVFLKQFRDVTNPDLACYQAIVEAPCRMVNFGGGGLIHRDLDVTVHDFASHPIRRDLGLAEGPLRPVLSFWCEFDFEIGYGSEIWRSE
jgi:hypothetical protein